MAKTDSDAHVLFCTSTVEEIFAHAAAGSLRLTAHVPQQVPHRDGIAMELVLPNAPEDEQTIGRKIVPSEGVPRHVAKGMVDRYVPLLNFGGLQLTKAPRESKDIPAASVLTRVYLVQVGGKLARLGCAAFGRSPPPHDVLTWHDMRT